MTCLVRSKLSVGSSVRADVICDWLDVTCSPIDSFFEALDDWLCGHGMSVRYSSDYSRSYSFGSGVLQLSTKFNVHRASASGAFLSGLREAGLYRDYINILGSVGHKITRLDAALDVSIDAPAILDALDSAYGGSFNFGRKALRTKVIKERRLSDDALTGTWYAGHLSKARVSARVYDKQQERLNHGIITDSLTRYEITFRKDYGCSLWDALMPKSIFYSHSSGLVDPPDGGFDDWASRGLVPWVSEPVDTTLTVEKFSKSLEFSEELKYLASKGAKFGDTGKALIMRKFEAYLDSQINALSPDSGEG